MEDISQQLDYNMLLLNHLNRISAITSSNVIDVVNKELSDRYTNPPNLGEKALEWSANYLYVLIPDSLHDKSYIAEKKEVDNCKGVIKDFRRLKAMINLLNRKGMLLSTQSVGRKGKQVQEEWDK
jgi:hypothetical protein